MAATISTYPLLLRAPRLPAVVEEGLAADHPLRGAVLMLGNFDGFHLGHQALARMAHQIAGDRPVAVMACEPHPRSFFGTEAALFRLATPAARRLQLSRYGVDFIYSPRFDQAFAGLSPLEFVDRILVGALGVRHVIAGPDFNFGNRRAGNMELLSELGATRGFGVSIAPDITHAGVRISSTLIRAAIEAGDLSGATRLMGHDWLVETQRNEEGGLRLHPTLCRPRPGRYLGSAEDGDERLRIEVTADGTFRPLGPHSLPARQDMWRLEG
jgi:riboflavin kinase/FMN adenylyltransferase